MLYSSIFKYIKIFGIKKEKKEQKNQNIEYIEFIVSLFNKALNLH
jgi:hypothetical protein